MDKHIVGGILKSRYGSLKKAAEYYDVSNVFLSYVLAGKKTSKRVLDLIQSDVLEYQSENSTFN